MKMRTPRRNQSGRSERSEALFTFLKENNKQYLRVTMCLIYLFSSNHSKFSLHSQVHVTCDVVKVECDAKCVLHVLTLQEVSCRSPERVS